MYVWQYLQYFISSKNNWNICKTMYFKAKSYIDKELLLFFFLLLCMHLSMWRIDKREIDYTGWKNDFF